MLPQRHHFIYTDDLSIHSLLFVNIYPDTCELLKNLVLMGYRKFSFLFTKDEFIEEKDVRSSYFFLEQDLGNSKFQVIRSYIKDYLEPSCEYTVLQGDIESALANNNFSSIIISGYSLNNVFLHQVNELARKYNATFHVSDVIGFFEAAFVDFGEEFQYTQKLGTDEDQFHYTIKEALKKEDENFISIVTIERLSRKFAKGRKFSTISLDTTSKETIEFHWICESVDYKENRIDVSLDISNEDYNREERVDLLKILSTGYCTGDFLEQRTINCKTLQAYSIPRHFLQYYELYCLSEEILSLAFDVEELRSWLKKGKKFSEEDNITDDLITQRHYLEILVSMKLRSSPSYAIQAGFLAHTIMVASTKSFTPHQWFFFTPYHLFTALFNQDLSSKFPSKSVLELQGAIDQEMQKLKVLQVGCGATGCETAKNIVALGIETLCLVDNDLFSLTNRNRQFYCKREFINFPKSQTIQNQILERYKNIDVNYYVDKVCERSNFSDHFYTQFDVFLGNVDNVPARVYLNQLACYFNKYFMECGTKTLSFSSSFYVPSIHLPIYNAPEEQEEIHMGNCTPKVLCFRDSHTIQASVDYFEDIFGRPYSRSSVSSSGNQQLPLLEFLEDGNEEQLQVYSHHLFDVLFSQNIVDILQSGIEWNIVFKKPSPLTFDPTNKLHTQWIDVVKSIFHEMKENHNVIKFEKDSPIHMEFIEISSRLKCENFNIPFTSSTANTQRIAGRILPSIVTSSAIAAALESLSFYSIAIHKLLKPQVSELIQSSSNYFGSLVLGRILPDPLVNYSNSINRYNYHTPVVNLSISDSLRTICDKIFSLPEISLLLSTNNSSILDNLYIVVTDNLSSKKDYINLPRSNDEELFIDNDHADECPLEHHLGSWRAVANVFTSFLFINCNVQLL